MGLHKEGIILYFDEIIEVTVTCYYSIFVKSP
jgi:hypothetical protein